MFTEATIVKISASPKEYHDLGGAKRGDRYYPMTLSSLREFAPCPHKWLACVPRERTARLDWGSLVDGILLCGDHVSELVAVYPDDYVDEKGKRKPWNRNATVCRQWEERQSPGVVCVSKDTMAAATRAASVVMANATAKAIFDDANVQVWLVARWNDEQCGVSFPVQTLVDIVPRSGDMLLDLKTTEDAEITRWRRTLWDHWYHVQAAWMLDIWNAQGRAVQRQSFGHIVSESVEPYECVCRVLSGDLVDIGRVIYTDAMHRYAQCLRTGVWPGYETPHYQASGFSIVDAEPWMLAKYEHKI